jgi:hypothetical protein
MVARSAGIPTELTRADTNSASSVEQSALDNVEVETVKALEESPWGGYAKEWAGGSFAPRSLARLLKPYDIAPKTIRFTSELKNGYYRAAFADAWSRYLSPDEVHMPNFPNVLSSAVGDVEDVDTQPDTEEPLF